MRDSEENLTKFAKIMERYPFLYFTSSNTELDHLWETVASSLRLETKEECTVKELQYKWNTMRCKYIYYAKKLSRGDQLSQQKEYDLYNALAFLYPYAAERYTDILNRPPPIPCCTDDNRNEKGKGKLKTIGKTSIRTYGNNKNTSAIDHHSDGKPDNVGHSTRSDGLVQNTESDLKQCTRSNFSGPSTRSSDLGQITEDYTTPIKTETLWDETEGPTNSKNSSKKYGKNKDTSAVKPDNLGQSTRSHDLVHSTRSDHLGQSSRSHELGQSTGSGDIGLSTEECSTAIKAEAMWHLAENPTSSDSKSNMKPNIMESINLMKVEIFPDGMTESTSFDVRETEGNLDLQFFRSILPDIANFTPQEKRKFRMGVLKLIDEIEEKRK